MGKILEALVEPFVASFVAGLYLAAHTGKPRQSDTKRTSPYSIEGNDHGPEKLSAGSSILSNR
jgi:hypothetical protein